MLGVALALLGGAAVAAKMAADARNQRDRARAARTRAELALGRARDATAILVDLLHTADPWEGGLADTVAARAMLGFGMAGVDALEGRPMLQAELLDALARVHVSLGRLSEAEAVATRSLDLRRGIGEDRPDVATSLRILAEVTWRKGRHREAENLLRVDLPQFRGHRTSWVPFP